MSIFVEFVKDSEGYEFLCIVFTIKVNKFDKDVMEEGSWAGAQSVLCPGVKMGANSLLTVGSVATSNLDSGFIYQGNPAVQVRERRIREVRR